MHKSLQRPGNEAIVDEEVFIDSEFVVLSIKITGSVTFHAVPQDQILRPRRRLDRIRLHKPKLVEHTFESGRREETAGHGQRPPIVERNRHGEMLSKVMAQVSFSDG